MIEKKLCEAPRVMPSATLDHKIQMLIDDSALCRRHLFRQPVPLWASAAACVAFALLGFFANQWIRAAQPQSKPEHALIYIVQPTEGLINLIYREDKKNTYNFFQTKKSNIHIITPLNKPTESLSF
jgi:hypothetical protein